MELVALTPLALGTLRWRAHTQASGAPGAESLTVIVKATFALKHDGVAELVEPYPLFDDVYFEENETRSLRAASDFAVRKPRADVLFTGGVYAPVGERTAQREARLTVGNVVDKTILAIGARDRDSTDGPAPFGHLPLRYELAYGGASSKSNPIGIGADADDPRMPNLVNPDNAKLVAGFGAVPRTWWWRKRALAGADAAILLAREPTLPAGIDLAYFNAAPPDQQVPYLRGDEAIALTGLHPTLAVIRSRLPGLRAHAALEVPGSPRVEVRLVADTLWIEGETLRCTLTWRGVVPLDPAMALALDTARLRAILTAEGAAAIWDAPAPPRAPPRAPSASAAERPAAPGGPALAPPSPPTGPRKSFAETTLDLELERPVVLAAKPAVNEKQRPAPPPRESPNVPIVNTTTLQVFTIPWQVKPPEDSLIVVVKATFALGQDGSLTLEGEQAPPSGDVYFDDDPAASLRYPSDFAIFKPAADVLLVGHAHKVPEKTKKRDPEGFAQGTANVELRFGDLRRKLAVFGDRRWGALGLDGKPAAFEKMPLRYERAMGGPLSETNPVGRGYKTGIMLPNLERPEALVQSPDDRPSPACFAPVAPMWRGRTAKLGTYDAKWLKARWPFFPQDFDWSYFNAAPPEQQVPYLRGDERFFLTGVHPEHVTIAGQLPELRPRVFAQKTAETKGDFFEVTLRLDTVHIDVDAMRVVLVWRGLFATAGDDAPDVASLFVTSDTVKTPLRLEQAQDRYFAELASRGVVPPQVLRFADEQRLEPLPGAEAAPPAPLPDARAAILALAAAGSLAKRDLTKVDLSGANLEKADLRGAILHRANLAGARLDGAQLAGAVLTKLDAPGASFVGADLTGAELTGARLAKADFSRARLDKASFDRCSLDDAIFAEATATRASFAGASLARAKLTKAVMPAADFSYATLDGADLRGATMDDAKLYQASAEGAIFDEASIQRIRCEAAKLPRSSFVSVNGTGSMWEGAELTGANFQGATLTSAIFFKATLDTATLNKTAAKEAQFRRASLKGARLIKANLMHASFEKADLTNADLRGANLYQVETWRAKTSGADLAQANVAGTKLAPTRG